MSKPVLLQSDARLVVLGQNEEKAGSESARLLEDYNAINDRITSFLKAVGKSGSADDSDTVVSDGHTGETVHNKALHQELTALVKESHAIGAKIQALLVRAGAVSADDSDTVVTPPT